MTDLQAALQGAIGHLDAVDVAIDKAGQREPPAIRGNMRERLRRVTAASARIGRCIELIPAREAAAQYLDGIDGRAERVAFGALEVPLGVARLMGCQAYLTVTWSIADMLVALSVRFLSENGGMFDGVGDASLIADIMGSKRTVPCFLGETLKSEFAWPAGLCYAARNLFVHEGGHLGEAQFFEGGHAAGPFAVSDAGWRYLVGKYQTQSGGFDETMTRAHEEWPWPQSDFRELMRICIREMDGALSVLVGTACASARAQSELFLH